MPLQPRIVAPVLRWYAGAARVLPWREPGTGAWEVLVSETMLQQTPVARVLPVYLEWVRRWPSAAALAAEPSGEAVRAWGRLGYPRRALRLHAAATTVVQEWGGQVPDTVPALLSLPGVGQYTARAVASFAFGQRHPVVDTNVRRVLARAVDGHAEPGPPSTTRDLAAAEALLPSEPATAAVWAVAVMELGALVCTARAPRCTACPLASMCAWQAAGRPAHDGPPARRPQAFAGTDRQVRGLLMAVVRDADEPVPDSALDAVWPDPVQRERARAGLVTYGLLQRSTLGWTLPG